MGSSARRILLCTLTMIDCDKLCNRQMLIINNCVQRTLFCVPHLTRILLRFLQCLRPPQSPPPGHPLQVRARTYVYKLLCTHVRASAHSRVCGVSACVSTCPCAYTCFRCVHLFTGSQMQYPCPMLCTCQVAVQIMYSPEFLLRMSKGFFPT